MDLASVFDYSVKVSRADDPCKKGYVRSHLSGSRFGSSQAAFYGMGAEHDSDTKWVGAGKDEWQRIASDGDHQAVDEARKLAASVEARVPLGRSMPELVPTVAGGAVCAPAALAGNPMCFQRPVWRHDATTPITIAVDIACSAGIEAEDMRKRGRAMLAVAMALQAVRPVRLLAFSNMDWQWASKEALTTIDLGVTPLDWARVGAVLGHPAALRAWSFHACAAAYGQVYGEDGRRAIGWGSGYDSGWNAGNPLTSYPKLRQRLGLGDQDIMFDRGYADDSKLIRDPEQWVLDILKSYAGIEIPD